MTDYTMDDWAGTMARRARIKRKTLNRVTRHMKSVDYNMDADLVDGATAQEMWDRYLKDVVGTKLGDVLEEEL
jgi:hypothetical protein